MLIAHVTFAVAPNDVDVATQTLAHEADSVRSMPGCIAYVPFVAYHDAGSVGVLHEWETAADFDAYLRSDAFAAMGAALRPLMTAPPVSKRFDATLAATVQ